jgi:hypothetical protein
MLRRTLLAALLVVGLLATVGIAVAAIDDGPDDDPTTSTTIDDGPDDDSTTSTTIDDGPDDDSTTSTTIDDGPDDDSTTSTTLPDGSLVEDGTYVIDASPAGTVTIAVEDGRLRLVRVDIAGEWIQIDTETSSREVKVEFENADTELEVKAEIEDGQLKTRVEFEAKDDALTTIAVTVQTTEP